MSYFNISLETLKKIAIKIEKGSPNYFSPNDYAFGQLLSQLTQDEKHLEAARGLLVFAIVNEEPNLTNIFSQEGIQSDDIEHDQSLIHLVELYKYVKTEFVDIRIPGYANDYNKKEFETMTVKALREIVKTDLKINEITSAVGTLDVLRDFFKKIPQMYRELTTDPDNKDRQLLIDFIQFVDDKCNNHPEETKIRLGLLLFVAMHIAAQYKHSDPKGTFFTPGSKLYQLIIAFLKVAHPSELTLENRIDLLGELSDLLDSPELPEKFGALDVELQKFRDELEPEAVDEFSNEMTVYKSIKQVASFGLMFFGAQVALLPAGPAGLVIPPAYMTLYLYGGDPSQLGTKIFKLMSTSEDLLTRISFGLYSRMFNKIYTAASGVNVMDITTPQEGQQKLYACMPPEDQQRFDNWMKVLLSLPEPILKKAERESICKVLGRPDPTLALEPEDEFEVIPTLSPASP